MWLNHFPSSYLFVFIRGSQQWMQNDRKVLDHDLPRKLEVIQLYFAVRWANKIREN